eukprot:scaffold326688_cov22-Prasinocladus_malaysianus.AAC.1
MDAWIDVATDSTGVWRLQTSNVRRFSVSAVPGLDVPLRMSLSVDGHHMEAVEVQDRSGHYCKLSRDEQWAVCNDNEWDRLERGGGSGPMRWDDAEC